MNSDDILSRIATALKSDTMKVVYSQDRDFLYLIEHDSQIFRIEVERA